MARDFPIRDPRQLLKNMVVIRDILAKHGIACWLRNGTCLGAIREGNFIAHDDDADLGIYAEDYSELISIVPEIEAAGFVRVITDSMWDGRLVQFVNEGDKGEGEQVDIFWERPVRFLFWKRWDLGGRFTVPWKYLATLDRITFLGEEFNVPHDPERFLRRIYGRTWRTPLKNVRTRKDFRYEARKLLAHPEKAFFYLRRFLGTKMRIYEELRLVGASAHGALRRSLRAATAFAVLAAVAAFAISALRAHP